jgi:hypothetical protein
LSSTANTARCSRSIAGLAGSNATRLASSRTSKSTSPDTLDSSTIRVHHPRNAFIVAKTGNNRQTHRPSTSDLAAGLLFKSSQTVDSKNTQHLPVSCIGTQDSHDSVKHVRVIAEGV